MPLPYRASTNQISSMTYFQVLHISMELSIFIRKLRNRKEKQTIFKFYFPDIWRKFP